MMDVWTDAVAILLASLAVAAAALVLIVFRPAARRRRRHKRHSHRPKIDLLRHEPDESAFSRDA